MTTPKKPGLLRACEGGESRWAVTFEGVSQHSLKLRHINEAIMCDNFIDGQKRRRYVTPSPLFSPCWTGPGSQRSRFFSELLGYRHGTRVEAEPLPSGKLTMKGPRHIEKKISDDKRPDFLLAINFPSELKDPQRVFITAANCLEALHSCDEMLLKSISSSIQPVFVLEQVETGSIKIWLKQLLENVPDDALNNIDWKPAVGQYLVKGKYFILKKLGSNKGLPDKAELKELSDDLHNIAKETGALKMPAYAKVSEADLANEALRLSKALSDLKEGESISFDCDSGDARLAAGYSVTEQEIDNLLIDQEITNLSDVILIIRRPDFLGETKWGFSFEKRNLLVSIDDKEWLAKFQAGEIDIRPGDALQVKLRDTAYYGANGEVIKMDQSIEKVIKVIRKQVQASLL